MWQSHSDDDCSNETFTDEIDAFPENSAQYGEANEGFTMLNGEGREEVN